jgi:hypothetical protein
MGSALCWCLLTRDNRLRLCPIQLCPASTEEWVGQATTLTLLRGVEKRTVTVIPAERTVR